MFKYFSFNCAECGCGIRARVDNQVEVTYTECQNCKTSYFVQCEPGTIHAKVYKEMQDVTADGLTEQA